LDKLNFSTFSLHNNGKTDYILGYSNSKENIKNANSYSDYNNLHSSNNYVFGYIPYDQKNNFLPYSKSVNPKVHNFNDSQFFTADGCFILKNQNGLFFGSEKEFLEIKALINKPKQKVQKLKVKKENDAILHQSTSRKQYLKNIKKIKQHIQNGDIYEMNYCINFQYTVSKLSGLMVYSKLIKGTKAPFSSFVQIDDTSIMSASPERFFNKSKKILTSQPIKGTIKRGRSLSEDQNLTNKLANDSKEISENVMIVDLVRNDMSKIADKDSVIVNELCKIYSFPTVHQLISTIQAKISTDIKFIEILSALFPMGSMTGAPKLKATQLIDLYEDFKREIYSGSTGFISPNNSADFNVVIRSIVHNKSELTTSISVGSAITINSIPENEYDECMLKLSAVQKALL